MNILGIVIATIVILVLTMAIWLALGGLILSIIEVDENRAAWLAFWPFMLVRQAVRELKKEKKEGDEP